MNDQLVAIYGQTARATALYIFLRLALFPAPLFLVPLPRLEVPPIVWRRRAILIELLEIILTAFPVVLEGAAVVAALTFGRCL